MQAGRLRSQVSDPQSVVQLVELRVLRLGLLQDRDVGIGVFPQCEEIPVVGERPGAGSVGCDSLICASLQRIGTRQSETRQRGVRTVADDSAAVDEFLELTRGSAALTSGQVRLASPIRRIQTRNSAPVLQGRGGWQSSNRGGWLLSGQGHPGINRPPPYSLHQPVPGAAFAPVLTQALFPPG